MGKNGANNNANRGASFRNTKPMLSRAATSSKVALGRRRDKDPGSKRSAETIRLLKLRVSQPIRNKAGKIVAGAFMMDNQAGDRPMDAQTGRIQPDRRWFGNTRTVDPVQLDAFRESMTTAVADPYSVVLKRKKLPMGLLRDAAEMQKHAGTAAILEQEPFEQAFGSKSRRKRVKLDQLLVGRAKKDQKKPEATDGEAHVPQGINDHHDDDDANGYEALMATAQKSHSTYTEVNNEEGMVPWGRDKNMVKTEGEGIDWRHARKDDLFLKGQSKRIWGEFFKVLDCSDVVLHVIDARNVPGTRCTMIEKHIQKNCPHKHLVFVLNKIDLVPNWVAKRWMGELAKTRPTIAFHASPTHAFGKGALISLLRQFGKLHQDKKQISVGIVGAPNVGKSSVINTLVSKKAAKVAPIPGETKIWQYVSLFKRISLVDCPGVVVDTAGDSETDCVLKGIVRAERLENPEDYIDAILEKVRREHVAAQYKLPKDGDGTWTDANHLLELVAKQYGRLRRGGDPCLRSAAIMVINDYQRGRLPHFVAPPELKQNDKDVAAAVPVKHEVAGVQQDLDAIGKESNRIMKPETSEQDVMEDQKESKGEDWKEAPTDSQESSPPESAEPTGVDTAQWIGAGEWDD